MVQRQMTWAAVLVLLMLVFMDGSLFAEGGFGVNQVVFVHDLNAVLAVWVGDEYTAIVGWPVGQAELHAFQLVDLLAGAF